MKKSSWLIIMLAIVALGMIPGMAGAQAEVTIKDFTCLVYNPNTGAFFEMDGNRVVTPSPNCNINVSCHGDLPEGNVLPQKAITLDYDDILVPCRVAFNGTPVTTKNWHETITPSGNVSLTCHYKCTEIPQ